MALQYFTSCRREIPLRARAVPTSISAVSMCWPPWTELASRPSPGLSASRDRWEECRRGSLFLLTRCQPAHPSIEARAGRAGRVYDFDLRMSLSRVLACKVGIERNRRKQIDLIQNH